MTVNEAIDYIWGRTWKDRTPGLERTQELLALMGNPEKELKFIHVGGTNGKGSTSSMLASIFQTAGYRTGLYTSPFITRFNDRMQVNGEDISDEELVEITEWAKELLGQCAERQTSFSFITCIAFEFFRRKKCDIVILEVGLGGEFDATNVIEVPECAVLCNVGLDHTEVLGDTVEKIATTKAKIFKAGGLCVTYPAKASVEQVYEARCREVGAELHKVRFDTLIPKDRSFEGQHFDFAGHEDLFITILGHFQLRNAAVVLTVAELLAEKWNLTEDIIREGLARAKWPARFEVLSKNPLFMIDGGHNVQCMEALAENIRDYLPGRRIVALTGVMRDKDYADMYKVIDPYIDRYVTILPDAHRGVPADELASLLNEMHAGTTAKSPADEKAVPADSVQEGIDLAVQLADKDGMVLAFGSLYTAGEIRILVSKKFHSM